MKKVIVLLFLICFFFSLFSVENTMIFIKGSRFSMGTSEKNEENYNCIDHIVEIYDFYISRFEITQEEFKAVMGYNLSYYIKDDLPVHNVTWYEAIEFCNKKSLLEERQAVYAINKDKKDPNNHCEEDDLKWLVTINQQANGYRLPTEAEWEYAARGGSNNTQFKYSGSNNPNEVAWYYDNSSFGPNTVGQKKPNSLNIYDMSGNMYEWCWDWYSPSYYKQSPIVNPQGPQAGFYRIIRGGCWLRIVEPCQVFFRRANSPNRTDFFIGFRIAANKEYSLKKQ